MGHQLKKLKLENTALSWRRMSMRKTCPIVLPEQSTQKDSMYSLNSESASSLTTLPNDLNDTIIGFMDIDEHNGNYCYDDTATESTLSTNSCLLSNNHDNDNQMQITTSRQNDHGHGHTNEYTSCNNQLPELNSLNNEFLNTILTTTQPYQQSSSNNPNNSSIIRTEELSDDSNLTNVDGECGVTIFDESRPRQLGRRSEARSRIVSITAERNAEGNQVNI